MDDIFIWDDNFLTNNELIDKQHIKLIEIINEAIKNNIHEGTSSKEKFLETKNKIKHYIDVHFKDEETIMDDHCVFKTHSDDHKRMHKEFINWYKSTFEITSHPSRAEMNETLEYLINWLAYHILNADKCLFRQIELIKSGVQPKEAFELEKNTNNKSMQPLVKALKALYYIILEKNHKLEMSNHELELRVRQRTAELELVNRRLEEMSLTDNLTGLPNRRCMDVVLKEIIKAWERYKSSCVVMFIDVDKFKSVNDTKGHGVGDDLLKWVAYFLKTNLRRSDIICRIGGDEFLVVCPETDLEGGQFVANEILRKLDDETSYFFKEFWKPSLSIGLCNIDEQNCSVEILLKKADEAMYQSKKKGGNLASISSVTGVHTLGI